MFSDMPPDTARRWVPGPAPASRVATHIRIPALLVAAVVRCARGSRQRLAVGALLLGGPSLVSAAAGAQRVAPAIGSPTSSPGVHAATDALEEQAATRVAAAVCSKRVVLLGELPEHGEARGFGVKARIVERLVARCGFRAVLFEAGSYDFFGLERAIAATLRAPGGPAAVAAGGFVAGAAVVGLVHRRRRPALAKGRRAKRLGKASRKDARTVNRAGELLQIVGSRSLLVDVHLLGGTER